MTDWPRWMVMWLIAVGLYVILKMLSWKATCVCGPIWKRVAYLTAWPGMDSEAFLAGTGKPVENAEWAFALCKTFLGVGTFILAFSLDHAVSPLVVGWLGMVGIIFTLHFGTFHLLSCVWRSAGCDAKPIMNWPIDSTSLAEFWGKRWNLAFRDLTHRFLFRPLTKRFGVVGATTIGFFASGLVHELAITVPAGSGYGGPTAFFLIQLVGILFERSKWGRPIRGRFFTAICLLAPLYWLFPPAFVEGIVVPFLRFLGGNS